MIFVVFAAGVAALWTSGNGPAPKVSGHATATTPDGRVFLFGGLTGSAGSPCTDALWVREHGEWKPVAAQNASPGPRMYAAAAVYGDALYVIGGWDPEVPGSGGSFKDEVWRLALGTLEWSQLEPIPGGPVSRHTACVVDRGDDSIVVVHTFRPGDDSVLVLRDRGLVPQPTTGEAPKGLSMCAACGLGINTMLLFGGSTREQKMSADAYALDADAWAWRKLEVADGKPTPRASCCIAKMDTRTAVVFGGAGISADGYQGGQGLVGLDETWTVRLDDHDRVTWTHLEDTQAPSPRVAARLDPVPEGGLLLSGGWNPSTKETFADQWRLQL
ncbi:hypothetical protein CTAYLR_007864 [Chrysophaeum taylorii]|uniref:N-acetylneuraminate epimerase n=1 Tax=Chrysophaeum taylorii TaxID=2483200 RepID=A0AAD7UC93_9STRA|nr:hypothetical protein CTAYLR_007864 [Chrysophaeum taylorii]